MTHLVTEIQRFCTHDGPGVRTTVFLKGCPLNCFWCHNPESRNGKPEIMFYKHRCIYCGECANCKNGAHSLDPQHIFDRARCTSCGKCAAVCPAGALTTAGRIMTTREIVDEAMKDEAFYGKLGGITLSGGEPLYDAKGAVEILKESKRRGLNTAVETCGFFDRLILKSLAGTADLLLWDIKDTNHERHLQNTGVDLEPILENLREADRLRIPTRLRCILLKGVNLDRRHLEKVKELFYSLKNCVGVELIPCHSLGGAKAESLGLDYPDLSSFTPSSDDMEMAKAVIFEK